MTPEQARNVIIDVLGRIAPEADLSALEPDVDLRDQLDIDSMDFLNAMISIHEQTGIDIPEADYGKMQTLEGAVEYLVRHGS